MTGGHPMIDISIQVDIGRLNQLPASRIPWWFSTQEGSYPPDSTTKGKQWCLINFVALYNVQLIKYPVVLVSSFTICEELGTYIHPFHILKRSKLLGVQAVSTKA